MWVVLDVVPMCPDGTLANEERTYDCLPLGGDAFYHERQATLLADGHGFASPASEMMGVGIEPGAGDPPLFVLVLALSNRVGFDTPTDHRLLTAAVGSAAIVVVGILATWLGGRRAGIAAAALYAFYPGAVVNDTRLLSESIYGTAVAVLLLLAYRLIREPTAANALGVGVAGGVCALIRGEGALLLVAAVVAALWASALVTRERLVLGLLAVGTGAALLLPWVSWNLVRFDEPVLITSGTGSVLLAGACDETFYGDLVGYYSFSCLLPRAGEDEESRNDVILRERATTYLADNLGRLPVVSLARVGRMWDLWDPFGNIDLNTIYERRWRAGSEWALWVWWAMVVLAVGGAIGLRRRQVPIGPLVAMAVAVTLVAAATFGVTRYRVPVEVAAAVLAGVGLDLAIGRWTGRPSSGGWWATE